MTALERTAMRPAARDDFDALTALLGEAGLPYADLTPGHLGGFLVAGDDAGLAGAVGLETRGPAALLRSFAVRPDCRSRGLGRALLDAAEALARERGVRELWLLTDTAADYFARRGFARTDRASAPRAMQDTTEFREMCPSSAVCMRKQV